MAKDYELVSQEELEQLRGHANEVPEKINTGTLQESIDRLNGNIEQLLRIFHKADAHIQQQYAKGFEDETVKLDKIIEQNQRLARGLLAVADYIEPKEGKHHLSNDEQALTQLEDPREHASEHPVMPEPIPPAPPGGYPLNVVQEAPWQGENKPTHRKSLMRSFS